MIFQNWCFENQEPMNRASDSWYKDFRSLFSHKFVFFRCLWIFGKNLSRDQMKVKFKTIQMLPTFRLRALLFLHFKENSCQSKKKYCKKILVYISVNGILLPKLFWPTVRKNCSSDREKLLKFEAESREFSKILRSLEQFIQTVKGQNNFW